MQRQESKPRILSFQKQVLQNKCQTKLPPPPMSNRENSNHPVKFDLADDRAHSSLGSRKNSKHRFINVTHSQNYEALYNASLKHINHLQIQIKNQFTRTKEIQAREETAKELIKQKDQLIAK